MLSPERLAAIVIDAATLAERLEWASEDVEGSACEFVSPPVGGDELIARWRSAVAGGDAERWSRRLAWGGFSEDLVQRALGGRRAPSHVAAWGLLLDEVSREAQSSHGASDAVDPRIRAGRAPQAFDGVLAPFIRVARRRVAASRDRCGRLVGDLAYDDLEHGLLQQLSGIASRALYVDFEQFRTAEGLGGTTVFGSALRGGSSRHYRAYVARTVADGMVSLFERYPVLARLLATRSLFWAANTNEFLDRLVEDHAGIVATFASGNHTEAAEVVRIQPNLSDYHREASSVAIVHFGSGLRIVYKPRSLSVDRCMYGLFAFLNARYHGLDLRHLALLERPEYGWVEFARTAPCESSDAVDRYFERGGMLLALSYVLGASDLHSGNVLACGENPTLIDLEVLFNPLVDTGIPVERSGRKHAHETVLATALIPTRSTTANVDYLDGGLLNRSAKQVYSRETVRYPNTDMMLWGRFEFVGGGHENVPIFDGQAASTREHLVALRRGFSGMYDALVAHRDALLADDGPLRAFEHATVRVVHRPTAVYDRLVNRTQQPRFLRSGVERSIEFERLKMEALVHTARPVLWNALVAEQSELEQGDVPVFLARPSLRTLWSGNGASADDALLESGYEAVAERVRNLNAEDRAQQLDLVRISFASADDYLSRLSERDQEPPADEEAAAIGEAIKIADTLLALRRQESEATWLGLVSTSANTSRLQALDVSVFDGTAGIALFLATLGALAGRDDYLDVADDCIRPVRRAVRDRDSRRVLGERLGIGGAHGIGGVAYVFSKLAGLSKDESYLDDALAAASAITDDAIARDLRLDVMFGSAGAVFSLAAVHAVTDDPCVRRQAIRGAHHLATSQLESDSEFPGHWLTGYGAPETGFAHGTAGIVGALARALDLDDAPVLRASMLAGAAALDACFLPGKGNWRDCLANGPAVRAPEPWCSWCRGAAGISLMRLLLANADGGGADASLEDAIETVQARDHPATDQLCCGTSGRIELLLAAAQRLERPALLLAARDKSARIRRERISRGSYNTGYVTELSPGLFQGIAGIGYQMLRVARPETVPSILLWE